MRRGPNEPSVALRGWDQTIAIPKNLDAIPQVDLASRPAGVLIDHASTTRLSYTTHRQWQLTSPQPLLEGIDPILALPHVQIKPHKARRLKGYRPSAAREL